MPQVYAARDTVLIQPGEGSYPGMVREGNIDLAKRPVVKNKDGTISTVRSMSVGIDGVEVLIPTVSDEGEILTEEQAVALYKKSGKHLGIFASPETADRYAIDLHKQQAKFYNADQPPKE